METLLMIKPNCTEKNEIGKILTMVEESGFVIERAKMFAFDKDLVAGFYAEHIGKEFFARLQDFMCSGKTLAVVLSKDNAIDDLRELVGNTDPSKAKAGTIRASFGVNVTRNGVHASDCPASAQREIEFHFGKAN